MTWEESPAIREIYKPFKILKFLLHNITFKKIEELIKTAANHKSINVMEVLMNYMNNHLEEYDHMEEFAFD